MQEEFWIVVEEDGRRRNDKINARFLENKRRLENEVVRSLCNGLNRVYAEEEWCKKRYNFVLGDGKVRIGFTAGENPEVIYAQPWVREPIVMSIDSDDMRNQERLMENDIEILSRYTFRSFSGPGFYIVEMVEPDGKVWIGKATKCKELSFKSDKKKSL